MFDLSRHGRRRPDAAGERTPARAEPPPAAARAPLARTSRREAILDLQRTAGNRQVGVAIARMGTAASVPADDTDTFESDFDDVAKLIDECDGLIARIEGARAYASVPHLANRFNRLKTDLKALIAEFDALVEEHEADDAPARAPALRKRLARIDRRLRHPDMLPLLRRTQVDADRVYAQELAKLDWVPKVPERGSLRARLNAVFEQAAAKNSKDVGNDRSAKEKLTQAIAEEQVAEARAALEKDLSHERWRSAFTPVRFLHVRELIHSSPGDERVEAARDEDLLDAAQRFMAPAPDVVPYYQPVPNEFPEFVKALGIKQVGPVQQYDERTVDNAIRSVLGAWVARPAAEGIEIPGHVAILKGRPFGAVKDKYTTSLPGAGKVNAFTEGGHIFIATSATDPSTIVHEGIHLYASGVIRRIFGDDIDEGFTEYFARMVAQSAFGVTRDKYASAHDVAAVLIERLDVDAVARAYFAGGIEAMQGRFRVARRDRHGVRTGFEEDWAGFCQKLKDKKYEEAKAMLA